MKDLLKFISLLLLVPVLGGCAVGMALHGRPDPNVGALKIGQDRQEVLLHLGQPSEVKTIEGGRIDIFRLQRGNQPSTGRAVAHGVMDLLTFGAWEIIGTPVEGFTGEKFTLTIEYDENDKVTNITSGEVQPGF